MVAFVSDCSSDRTTACDRVSDTDHSRLVSVIATSVGGDHRYGVRVISHKRYDSIHGSGVRAKSLLIRDA